MKKNPFLEELLSSITHGIGALLSVVALIVLIMFSFRGDLIKLLSFIIYGLSLVILYLSSTLLHAFSSPNYKNLRVKRIFRFFDHSAIYLLISGTYTPICFLNSKDRLSFIILGILWGLSIIGIFLKYFYIEKFYTMSVLFYILMSWFVMIDIKPIIQVLTTQGFKWLLAGGLFYTLGVIFYFFEKLPFNHVIWHFFVLGGSACHFFLILNYVLPR